MYSVYSNKIEHLSKTNETMINEFSSNKEIYYKNLSNIVILKNLISNKYQDVLQDLTKIIEFKSVNSVNKDNNLTVEEESPASIIKMLDLSWNEHRAVDNTLIQTHKFTPSTYTCVSSRQVLNGTFLCKVLIEEIIHKIQPIGRMTLG